MQRKKQEVFAYIAIILTTSIIGLSFVFVKIALRYAPSSDLLAHRFMAASLAILALWILGVVKFPKISKAQLPTLLTLATLYPFLFFLFQTFALKYITVAEASIYSGTAPVLTLLLSSLIIKEGTTIRQKVSIVLSVVGIAYISISSGGTISTSLWGKVLLVASVLSMVFFFIFSRKAKLGISAIDTSIFMIWIAMVGYSVWALALRGADGTIGVFFQPLLQPPYLLSILYLGILSSFVSSFLLNYSLSVLEAYKVSVFNNFSPIIGVVAGVLILNESLFYYHIVGGILVLLGIVGTIVKRR